MRDVVARVADMSDWAASRRRPGVGMGIAFHFSHRGYFAEVARVRVTDGTKVKVEKVWAVGDVGRHVINPSTAINQVQGAVIEAMSHVMTDRNHLDRGRAVQSNFHDFELVRYHEAPAEIEVDFVKSDNSTDRPRRAGPAAGRAGDLQRDLCRDRQALPFAAAGEARFFLGVIRH